jgi:peptidoglycan/xylan/chitin deacetylase (PgdA/CDA1 family)
MPSVYFKLIIVCLTLWQICKVQARSQGMDNGVILMYHHVSEKTPGVTTVSPKLFAQHMQYVSEHHRVLPLQTLVSALQEAQGLPDKALALTFDDGYENIFKNAHPILYQYNLPYTVFINPSLIGVQANQLNWQQVKLMAQQGATFANHGNTHKHMLARDEHESEHAWLERVMADIELAEQQIERQLGYSLRYIAYPYGEFELRLKNHLSARGYTGFAQHSGAVASHSDFSALPRYPAAGIYAKLETLKVKLNSLAMPVSNIFPDEPKLPFNAKNVGLSFTVKDDDLVLQQVACFGHNQALPIIRQDNRLTVDLPWPIPPGRSRVNCTAPSVQYPGRYYWFSQAWFVADKNGKWLD